LTDCTYMLIAEDDHEARYVISESLGQAGANQKLAFVENGEEILSTLDTDAVLPALIILDLNMPKMNGKETVKQLKSIEKHKHIPAIIFSTSLHNKDVQECMEYGALECFRKPNTFGECVEVARRFLQICSEAAREQKVM
jgi:CheY-like chemotaxis protein